MPLQRNGLGDNASETDIRPPFIVGNIEGPAHSKNVSQLNIIMTPNTNEFGLYRENLRLDNNAANMCHGLRTYSVERLELHYLKSFLRTGLWWKLASKLQRAQSMTRRLEGFARL